MMSIPVQCTQEIPFYLHEKPQQLTATGQNPAAQLDCLSGNVGTFSDLLTKDMSKLCVEVPHQRKEDGKLEQKVGPLLSQDSSRWQGASANASKNLLQADNHGGDRTMHTVRVGVFTRQKSPPVARGSPVCPWTFPCCCSKNTLSCPLCLCQMSAAASPSLVSDFPSQPGGLLISDVALQSHVCEFCQAVFPGDTTTRGEFLRHLCTHVT